MRKDIWVGVDVGGTKTAVVLSRKPPEVISRTEFATLPAKGPQQSWCLRLFHEAYHIQQVQARS